MRQDVFYIKISSMKINLPIIFDQLNNDFQLLPCNRYDLSIEMVLFYYPQKTLDPKYVYLITGEEYDRDPSRFNNIPLIINGIGKYIPDENAILIFQKMDAHNLYDKVMTIFLDFEEWNQTVLKSIIEKRDIESIARLIGEKLVNPACVLDLSFRMQCIIGEIKKDMEIPKEWEDLLTYKESPVDTFDIPSNDIYFFARHGSEIYEPVGSPYNNHDIFLNIYVHGELFMILANCTGSPDFSEGEYSIMLLVRDYFEQYYTSVFKTEENQNVSQYYLSQLLDGREINQNALAYHLAGKGWKQSNSYQVCCLMMSQIDKASKGQLEHALSRIQKIMGFEIAFIYFDSIILISKELDVQKMYSCIKKTKLVCGISFTQCDIMNIKKAYNQALLAIHYGREEQKENDTIYFFENYLGSHLNQIVSLNLAVGDYIPPAIQRLQEYDRKNRTNYMNILKTYLLSGLNFKKASERLYMHRNTLIYRIEKIESIMGVRLDECSVSQIETLLIAILVLIKKDQEVSHYLQPS